MQLLRFYAKRSDYAFRLKPGQTSPLACVIPGRKRVEVTTAFPSANPLCEFALGPGGDPRLGAAPADCVRHYELLSARPTETWLKGFVGHEAGHILFSGEKPEEPVLGWLWNALEDERMERLAAARYGELGPIFETMGDVMLTETKEDRDARQKAAAEAERRHAAGEAPAPKTILGACLNWRWLSSHARAGGRPEYHPYLTLPEEVFAGLRPRIEAAWTAGSSEGVTEIAREILGAYDIPAGIEVPEGLPAGDVPAGQAPAEDAPAGGLPDENALADDPFGGGGEESGGPSEGNAEDEDDGAEDGDGAPGQPRRGGKSESKPEMPGLDPHGDAARAGARLLSGLAGEARKLSQALRPRQRGRLRTPHRSRGRYEYRRHVQGRSRVFTRQPRRAEPPAFLTVLLDLSESMTWGQSRRLGHAQKATALLSAATEMAGTHMRVIPFQERPGPPLSTRSSGAGHEAVRAAVASASASGGTQLAPALKAACSGSAPPGGAGTPAFGKHIVVLITDGALDEEDARAARQVYRRLRRARSAPLVLPLLIGDAAPENASGAGDPAEAYKAIFEGRYAAVEDAGQLAEVAARWIKSAA